jgi:hypothetical protein
MERYLVRLVTPPMAPALNRIDAGELRLRGTAGAMEARFLESSNAMEDLSRSSQSLVDNSAELVRLATGRREAEQIIAETMAVLNGPLEFLSRYTDQLGEHTASLEKGCALLSSLLNFEADLQAAVAPLRATRTMFRVEAARLPEADQAAFLALSDQIEMLHNQVRDTLGTEFARLSETRTAMNALVKHVGNESAVQREVLSQEKDRIAAELAKLNRQIDFNSTREIQLTALGRVVQGAVSRVVMALQNQDFVAQRTEHLFEGLKKIRSLGKELAEGDGKAIGEGLAHLRAMLEIQAGQAASALVHLKDTADTSGSATAEILATVDALDHGSLFLKEFSDVTAAANGTLQVLLDIVEKTRQMVSSAVQLGAESLEQIQPVNALTMQLGDTVERLSHQMNLVAMNAQIQALQTGEGTGLEVLAAHTAGVATETSRFGEAISADFERLREFLKIEMEALAQLCETGRVHQDLMEGAGREHENGLHGIRDTILSRLHQIAEDALTVRTNAARMASTSLMRDAEAEGFRQMQAALSSMAEGLGDAVAVCRADDIRLSVDDAGYTMAAERDHHRKVLGEAESGAGEQDEAERNQVELF